MADSETVAEASAAAAVSYAATGYADAIPNPVPEAVVNVAESSGEGHQANATYELNCSTFGDGNAYSGDPNSVLQQAQFNSTDGIPQTDTNQTASGNTAAESAQVTNYNPSVNGVDGNATGLENGSALENIDGSADVKQLADGYGMMFSTCIML